jgi:uncharacterized membrane protein SpoIIM required for sporulation
MVTASNVRVDDVVVNFTGVFAVALAIIPSSFFLKSLIEKEVRASEKIKEFRKLGFYRRYKKDLTTFLFFFLGVTYAFAIWSFVLPPEYFAPQFARIEGMTGRMITPGLNEFTGILLNNLGVTFLSFIFSLVYGAGAIFIITWNASLLGVCIGRISRFMLEIPIVFLQFLPHGIPEILGYLCAGLAGGILSAALMRGSKANVDLMLDSLKLLGLAVSLIIIAAFIEVYFIFLIG